MEKELHYAPVLVPPTKEELRSVLKERSYLAYRAIRDFVHANYEAEERWRYSDQRDAFDCLFYEGDKRLCSLHLREGTLSILVLLDEHQCEVFTRNADEYSDAAQVCFRSAAIREDNRWVRAVLEDTSLLEDIFALLRLKADLTGIDKIGADTVRDGDDQK